jgi:hypothetical protein
MDNLGFLVEGGRGQNQVGKNVLSNWMRRTYIGPLMEVKINLMVLLSQYQ